MSKFSNSINSSTAGARQWRALPWGQGDHCHSHLGPGKPDSIRSILHTWDRIIIFTEVDGAVVKWWSKFNF